MKMYVYPMLEGKMKAQMGTISLLAPSIYYLDSGLVWIRKVGKNDIL